LALTLTLRTISIILYISQIRYTCANRREASNRCNLDKPYENVIILARYTEMIHSHIDNK